MDVVSKDLEPIPIFLNSFLEATGESTANRITFNFRRPIVTEPNTETYVALSQFTAFNTFTSISANQGNNVFQIVNVFYDAVDKVYDYTTYSRRFVIPDNRYSISSLFAYLNDICTYQVQVTDANWYNYTTTGAVHESWLNLGFGFNGENNTATQTPVIAFSVEDKDNGICQLFPADFTGNTFGNPYEKTYTIGDIESDPYVYAGVYLVSNPETVGFLTTMGFLTQGKIPQAIANTPLSGVGFTFNVLGAPFSAPAFTPPNPFYAPGSYNLFGPSLLYFTIDGLSSGSRSNDSQLDNVNIINSIPISTFSDGLISFNNQSPYKVKLQSPTDFTSFSVTLYDEVGNVVDFRGGKWQARLDFTFQLQKDFTFQSMFTANPEDAPRTDSRIPIQQRQSLKRGNPFGGVSSAIGFGNRGAADFEAKFGAQRGSWLAEHSSYQGARGPNGTSL